MTSLASAAKRLALTLTTLFVLGAHGAEAAGDKKVDLVNRQVLRVCADPSNLPFSAENGDGFENKIANLVAEELKLSVEYTWFPQATGFVRRTLFAKACDVIMGFAQGDELVQNTNHYYRSTYALLYRDGAELKGVETLDDPRLQGKRIGIIAGTPPSDIMAKNGLMTLAKPYPLTVDRRYFSPAQEMIEDIRKGEIAAGVLWGPIGGYFSQRDGEKLVVKPLIKESFGPRMAYRITFGVRNGEDDWKRQLNEIIKKRQVDIDKILLDYGVPLLDEQNQLITTASRK
jgi:quinoprotein dehydrogenase-associated probable ABC transporter substrate-binding protein